jgi:hypothetical protein
MEVLINLLSILCTRGKQSWAEGLFRPNGKPR